MRFLMQQCCTGTYIWHDMSKRRQQNAHRSPIDCPSLPSVCGALNQDSAECCVLLLDKSGGFSVVQTADGSEQCKVDSIEASTVRCMF